MVSLQDSARSLAGGNLILFNIPQVISKLVKEIQIKEIMPLRDSLFTGVRTEAKLGQVHSKLGLKGTM